jgi:predicted ATPase
MLASLHLTNFTVFQEETFQFGKHLNVFVGENGTGKTHALKIVYAALSAIKRDERENGNSDPTKTILQKTIARKLRGVFQPDEIGRLARRQAGRNRCEVECDFYEKGCDLSFSFNTSSRSEVSIDRLPSKWNERTPVYLPTRELLTIAPGFVSLYDTTHLPFEETWRDTISLLSAPLMKGAREKKIRDLLKPLEEGMEGSVEIDEAGGFYLRTKNGRIEMHLVAEGLRKLAMIARLIASGSLLEKGYLFWDEPEANLNPKIIKIIAKTILQIAKNGVQIFVATHSLFLLRELYILQLQSYKDFDVKYFGLHKRNDRIELIQGDTVDDIGDINALDEELAQSERYLEAEDQSMSVRI